MKYIFILSLFLFVGCDIFHPVKPPTVKDGFLDLSNWDFEKNGSLNLDGNWEFYWEKLYTPADFTPINKTVFPEYLSVRGSWNNDAVNRHHYPSFGFATYRIKIKLKPNQQQLALKLPEMSSEYKLWVNNNLVASNGKVSNNADSAISQYLPLVAVLQNEGQDMTITVQISNYFHAQGGIWESIRIGSSAQILKEREDALILAVFVAGALLILAIYHLLLFFLRRKETSALIFALVCISFIFRSIVTGERVLFHLLPSFSVNVGLRIEYISLLLVIVFLSLFIFQLFRSYYSKTIIKIIIAIGIVFSATIIFANTLFYSSYVLVVQAYLVFACVYDVWVGFVMVLRKKQFGFLFFIPFCVLFIAAINDILYANYIINTAYFAVIAFSVFLLVQAYIVGYRSTTAFNNVENLSVELNAANINLEEANINLEHKVELRTRELAEEKQKSDKLLLNILPEETAQELKKDGRSLARTYEMVTVMFTDFKNFTMKSELMEPRELVAELDACFSAFDAIVTKYHIEKIKTIGDAYMAASGLPVVTDNHAIDMVNAAIEIRDFMIERKKQYGEKTFEIRIGIHSGPVIAGIVGVNKFSYDIWGDTVNTAARMEQNAEPGKINISSSTYKLVKEEFICISRGEIEAKHKGKLGMYFVS